jgi:hypothetical protein
VGQSHGISQRLAKPGKPNPRAIEPGMNRRVTADGQGYEEILAIWPEDQHVIAGQAEQTRE